MGGTDPVVYRPSTEEMSSTAGIMANPTTGLFTTMTGPSPYVVFLVAFFVPFVTAVAPGDAQVERVVAVGLGWVGFGLLYYRHTRREAEADAFTSRGVPL